MNIKSNSYKKLLIIGAGGHSRVVIDTAERKKNEILGIIDINYKGKAEKIFGYNILGGIETLKRYDNDKVGCFIAIGNCNESEKYYNLVKSYKFDVPNLVHPTAILSKYVDLSEGVFINAGSIINAGVKIGNNVIINTGSIIDHEICIGNFSHIAPGCKIAGRVSIGESSFIGAGACIIDYKKIGNNVTIGAGSVVINNVKSNEKVAGIPAKKLK